MLACVLKAAVATHACHHEHASSYQWAAADAVVLLQICHYLPAYLSEEQIYVPAATSKDDAAVLGEEEEYDDELLRTKGGWSLLQHELLGIGTWCGSSLLHVKCMCCCTAARMHCRCTTV